VVKQHPRKPHLRQVLQVVTQALLVTPQSEAVAVVHIKGLQSIQTLQVYQEVQVAVELR
jgi:hypothetical protein